MVGFGGADRDRTDDLLNAIQALSQLSYSPTLREGTETNATSASKFRLDCTRAGSYQLSALSCQRARDVGTGAPDSFELRAESFPRSRYAGPSGKSWPATSVPE